jgi:phenylalanyl-tRNA synthetase alpha chain
MAEGYMSDTELTVNEKRVLQALDRDEGRPLDPRTLSEETGVQEDAVMQSAFMLAQNGFCSIKEEKKVYYRLTEEGKFYAEKGLPERRALDFLMDKKSATIVEFKNLFPDEKEANISTNWLLRKGWARFAEQDGEKVLTPTGNTSWGHPGYNVDEVFLRIARDEGEVEENTSIIRIKESIPEIADESLKGV